MRAELIVAKEGKYLFVLKGKISWISERALAYQKAGFETVVKWEQK